MFPQISPQSDHQIRTDVPTMDVPSLEISGIGIRDVAIPGFAIPGTDGGARA